MKLAALLLLVGACKDAKELTDHLPQQQRALQAKMSTWMPATAHQLWQGAWLLQLADDAPPVAVDVRGDKAVLFDGVDEKQVEFRVIEPCAVAFGSQEIQFVIDAGKIRAGRGAAGMRKGTDAIVCGDGRDPGAPEEGVYLVEGNRCATWKRDANSLGATLGSAAWSFREGVCVWANARGEDLLETGTEHYRSLMVVKGDLLEEREFTKASKINMRATSWDAAKTSAAGSVKPASKLDQAKAAGGTVGDTKTIAGLHATYASSPQTLAGQDFEIAGVLVEVSTQTVHGKTVGLAIIAEQANPKSMQLLCETAGAVKGVKPGDAVTVKGAIDTRHDYARLRRCSVTKSP